MMNGVINVLKPAGMTSHDVVSCIRRIYGLKKVGHVGTLDPLAAGVLPVFIGAATRFIEYVVDEPKVYVAEWIVGAATDTEDASGTVVNIQQSPGLLMCDWIAGADNWLGEIWQVPSSYSAIKVNGKKAYELARVNKTVELPKRLVRIDNIDVLKWSYPVLRARITCSKGTYIRALGRDWANSLGTVMTMNFLLREQVGPIWHVNSAWTLEEIEQNPAEACQPVESVLSHLPEVVLSKMEAGRFQNGMRLRKPELIGESLYVVSSDNQFLGIGFYSNQDFVLRPRKVWRPV